MHALRDRPARIHGHEPLVRGFRFGRRQATAWTCRSMPNSPCSQSFLVPHHPEPGQLVPPHRMQCSITIAPSAVVVLVGRTGWFSRLMTLYWGGYDGTDLIPPEGWPFAIIHTNDNLGAPSLQTIIKETLRKAHELAPTCNLGGRMSDFYTHRSGSPSCLLSAATCRTHGIDGYMSMPKNVRSVQPYVVGTERASKQRQHSIACSPGHLSTNPH